jgi:hypothetical protein
MSAKGLRRRQHRVIPAARGDARRERVSFIAVSVKRHRGENLNHAESCSGSRRVALRWINSADHELRSDATHSMIRLRLTSRIPADLASIARRGRFSRAAQMRAAAMSEAPCRSRGL